MTRFERRQESGILFLALVILAVMIFGGCVSLGPSAAQLKALSDSKRSWCITQSNVYVPYLMIGGTGVEGGSMECNKDGMKVNDKGQEVVTEKVKETTRTTK